MISKKKGVNIKLIVIFIVLKLNKNRARIRVGHTITRQGNTKQCFRSFAGIVSTKALLAHSENCD
jgi:hypothetical protein